MKWSSSTKAIIAGVSGTALQWYDFAIFGYFAPIIATNYFPKGHQFAALLGAFGVFAVGFLLAPLGSVLFGYIGDHYGRKRALTLSILSMAIPSAMISLLPSYYMIGIAAPLLMTLLRIIQGLVASAEFTGSAIFLVEHAASNRKAFYGCLTSSAYSTGLIVAGLAASLFTASFMPDWAWRLGFACALIGGVLVFYLRMHVSETPEYQRITTYEKPKYPIIAAFKESPHAMIGVVGIAWLVGIMTFGTYVFTATYLHSYFNISLSMATLMITVALAVDALFEPFIALYADKVGHIKVISAGMLLMMLLSIPIFYALSSGDILLIMLGLIGMSILIAITYAPLNAYMVCLFPHQHRFSGFGVSFNVGISIFGGTTPLVLMWLVETTDNFIAPAFYYIIGTMIGLISIMICEAGRKRAGNFAMAT